jgi:4-hydroxy-tetrahydrodipicolinate reductase
MREEVDLRRRAQRPAPLKRDFENVAQARIAVGVHGASGRMGKRLIQLIGEDPILTLAAAIDRPGHPQIGRDAGPIAGVTPLGVTLSDGLPPGSSADVIIDFSLPDGTLSIVEVCKARGIALVVGTTGFSPGEREQLQSASAHIPLLISPNMSRAVNLLMKLVATASASLGPGCDIAIVERHHRTKKDAPSGTALRLAEYASRGRDPAANLGKTKQASQTAPPSIEIHALRVGDSAGEHTVIFGLPGEVIELSHRASNRDGFAYGALDAAKFLAGKPAGFYSMEDVLA